MEAINLWREDTTIIFIEARINLSRFVVRLRRQNVGYSNFSQPQSHLSFCVLLQYLVERRRVVTQLGKLDLALRGQICHCEHFHPEVAAHSDSEQLLGK